MALENYLEQTKLHIANITFTDVKDNLTAMEIQALKTLNNNSELNLKKAGKGTTTVVMDTPNKLRKVLNKSLTTNSISPLEEPNIVSLTAV